MRLLVAPDKNLGGAMENEMSAYLITIVVMVIFGLAAAADWLQKWLNEKAGDL